MLEERFNDVYRKFKLHFYMETFARFQDREASLTTVESFAMEAIAALGSPTVHEFATFMRISSSNAAYKIGSLIKKGYVEKVQSESDGREYHLRPTQKYPRLLQRERVVRARGDRAHQAALLARRPRQARGDAPSDV